MSRHKMVEVNCEWCGVAFMARKQRVDKGQSRFCSRLHYREWLKENPQMENLGKENASMYIDTSGKFYRVVWVDPETMKQKTTTWARWAWWLNFGEVPEGYRVSFKDGNPLNTYDENLFLKHVSEYTEIGDRARGVPRSDETKAKLSASHTGKVLSDEHKANIGKAVGEMWKNGVFDSPETRAAYSRQGRATKGSKRTEEQKERMSKSHKGLDTSRLHTPEAMSKKISKLLGRATPEEVKRKISQAMKGREVSEDHRTNLSKSLKGRFTGELSSGYKDGKSLPDYPREFSSYIKNYIRRRDEYMCQSCAEDVHQKGKGQVHHIDNDKTHNDEDNMILLCVPCHQAVHGKRPITNEMIEYLKTRLTR